MLYPAKSCITLRGKTEASGWGGLGIRLIGYHSLQVPDGFDITYSHIRNLLEVYTCEFRTEFAI